VGRNQKTIEVGDGFIQVRWTDYTTNGSARYQWFLRDSDSVVIDGGTELLLARDVKPSASKALIELMLGLRAGAIAGETTAAMEWAADNFVELDHAIEHLSADLGLQQ